MVLLQTAVDVLRDRPELLAVLVVVLRAARAYQTDLSWAEYRAAHRFKRGVFPLLDRTPIGEAILLVSDKGGREDGEYIGTVDAGLRATVQRLRDAGASLHLLNSIKRRPDTHGDPLTAAHVVWTIDGEQVEAYLFRNSDGTTEVYAHTEAAVDDPIGHLTGPQTDGDRHGVLPALSGG
jgi:hypothetical protein